MNGRNVLQTVVSFATVTLLLIGCGPQETAPAAIPVSEAPAATSTLEAPAATPTPEPPTATPTPVPPTPKPPTATPTPTPQSHQAIVSVEALNLREGPGIAYRIIGGLKQGDTLTITSRSPNKGWIEVITAEGKKGWCSALDKYVQLNVDLDKVAVAKNIPPEPTQVAVVPTPTETPTAVPIETPTPTTEPSPIPTPTPQEANYVLYFYAGLEGCPYSRRMGPKVEQLYQEFGPIAVLPGEQHAGLAAPLALPPIQATKRGVEFYLVAVPGWGTSESSFRNATGVSFPRASNPGLPVSTNRIPVSALYNKQSGVTRVAAIGDVPYSSLANQVNGIMQGQAPQPATGGA